MTMGKSILPVVLAFAAIASPAHAQRFRNSAPRTVDGPVSMPEYRMAGGNLLVYQQIMQEKAMIHQQQAYAKMVQQQQKLDQQYAKSTSNSVMALPVQTRPRKKRHGIDESKIATPAETKAKPETTSKAEVAKPKAPGDNP